MVEALSACMMAYAPSVCMTVLSALYEFSIGLMHRHVYAH